IYLWIAPQRRVLVRRHPLDEIDFAVGDGVGLRLRVRQDNPLHTIDFDRLAARGARCRFFARDVFGVLDIDDAFAGTVLIRLEDEGTRTDVAIDLLVRRRFSYALGHDERRNGRRL